MQNFICNYNNPLLCKKDVATSLTASLTDVPLAFFMGYL